MDAYEKLREILDASPTGAPASNAFDEILRILFTPQEAALAVHMTLFPRPVETIASEAGIPLKEARKGWRPWPTRLSSLLGKRAAGCSMAFCPPSQASLSSP